uniref:RBR-type E3 ubiquitin transferase n=1 Tax=Araucaria cunninghamii TaxID=56994 RepID=A0A0D6R6J1_ARACU
MDYNRPLTPIPTAEEEEIAEEQEGEEFRHEIEEAIAVSLEFQAHQFQLEEVIILSDAEYAAELQLQEAIEASNSAHVGSSSSSPNIPQEAGHEYEQNFDSTQVGKGKHPRSGSQLDCSPKRLRTGSPIAIVNVQCRICFEDKQLSKIFESKGCSHGFCHDCIARHVLSRMQEKLVPIPCPDPNCSENLSPDDCGGILPKKDLDNWCSVLVEADIPLSQRYYCPFKDCSTLLWKDDVQEVGTSSGGVIRQSECPSCRRLFCAHCGVPWHAGLECDEFQRLDPSERGQDDVSLLALAKEKQWQRCLQCKSVVEKDSGCPHMICRCGFEFCYKCGSQWKHARVPCECPGWEEEEEDE